MPKPPRVVHGDCLDIMRMLPNDSVDSIVTDPPYGLGFMGKAWDALPPGQDWAEECLRVLKPGGHLLAFGGTRTWHRLAVAVEDAGFEIRDSIAWMYGSGFPKHRAALKPAFEPVVMARKPFKGSLTANEAIHGTGALDIDGCRIAVDPDDINIRANASRGGDARGIWGLAGEIGRGAVLQQGRWPANVVLDEHMAGVLDAQSGVIKDRNGGRGGWQSGGYVGGAAHSNTRSATYKGEGGASRFFKVAGSDEHGAISELFPREFDAPFMYVAKAPKKERPIVDSVAHPTVKPLTLMRWLVRLVTPDGGTVLEPFAGSGATVEACILEGFHCIAIEREAEYLPLIQARIDRQDAA
jgi:site-specific DNA-methyltransferase (adenine-specific)